MNADQKKKLSHAVRKVLKKDYGLDTKAASQQQVPIPSSQQPTPVAHLPGSMKIAAVTLEWAWKGFTALIALVGLVATLLAFYPRFQIQLQQQLDPLDVLTSPFEIQYEGPIPLRNIEVYCVFGEVSYEGIRFENIEMHPSDAKIPQMFWGDSGTFTCPTVTQKLRAARIQIWLDYSPVGLSFMRRSKIFTFATLPRDDGTLTLVRKVSEAWGSPKKRAGFVFVRPKTPK